MLDLWRTSDSEFNAERFPDSWNDHDSLGEALVKTGRCAEAKAIHRRALELNPRLSASRTTLQELETEQ